MPDKTKSAKPKIKVEEIPEEESVLTPPRMEEETAVFSKPPESEKVTPKVSSFSQLDVKASESKIEPNEKAPEEVAETKTPEESTENPSPAPVQTMANEGETDVSSEKVKEWLKEVRPDTSKENEKSGGPDFKIVLFIALILLILGTVVGGVYYYKRGVVTAPSQPTPQPTTTEKVSPTPTPTQAPEEVDLSKYFLSVLNGSGVAGEAGRVRATLVEAGFSENNVQVGNADSTDYKDTEVQMKTDLPEGVFEAIQTALGKTYSVVKSDKALEEDSKFDVIITVGKKTE